MKFLINELSKYVNIENKSKEELIDIFTSLAFEVEEVYPAAQIEGVRLARTFDRIKHPDADTLSFLKTEVDGQEIEVVCGASNIDSNMIVAHAVPGSKVGELTMAPKELRGIVSNGMILSISEITGLSKDIVEDSEKGNIVVFPEGTDLNSDVLDVLNLKGDVFDLSILPDRQYAASYYAMAREVATYIGEEFKFDIKEVERTLTNESKVILGEEANSLFATNVIINEEAKTPMWMKTVLYHAGIKPSNNIEDVSKFTMLMTGGITYIVDRQETYQLNDRKMNEVDIFESTALNTNSKEAAFVTVGSDKRANFVNEKNINKTFGSRSIKGTNTEAAELSSKFAIAVAMEAGFIEAASETVFEVKKDIKEFEIEDSYIYGYLGKEIDINEIAEKLINLGIKKEGTKYIIPSYRKDIEFKADVIEEIARIYGVQNIEANPYEVTSDTISPEKHKEALIKVTNELPKYGFVEIKTYQLVTEEQAVKNNIWGMDKFVNLREDYTVDYNHLQTSLLSGLLESFKLNHRNDKTDIRLFEIGNVFHNEQPIYSLGIIHDEHINEEPILGTKELVLRTLESIGVDIQSITFESKENKVFNPYISSEIKFNGETIGLIGEIHPSILREHKFIRLDKVKARLYYAEIQLEKII